MNTHIITLSVERLRQQVLARVALRHHLGEKKPEMLTGDHREGVDLLIKAAFGPLCLAMLPVMVDCNADDTEADELRAEIKIPDGLPAIALRIIMEHAVAAHTLAELYAGVDERAAAVFADEWHTLSGELRRVTRGSGAENARIIRW